jgi:CO/xanthine dehydrogenase Mo-binding subunit
VFGAHLDFTAIRLKLNDDDSIILYTGSHDMGNGSVTVQKMIVSEELRIPVERISAVESDTENCPYNLGDYASRGVFVSAEAARRAALSLRGALLRPM